MVKRNPGASYESFGHGYPSKPRGHHFMQCRWNCGSIVWKDDEGLWHEQYSDIQHTMKRCSEIKQGKQVEKI